MELNACYTDLRSKIIFITERHYQKYSVVERKAYAYAAFLLMKEKRLRQKDILAGYMECCNISDLYPHNLEEELRCLKKWSGQDFSDMIYARELRLLERNPGCHVIPAYDKILKEGLQFRINRVKEKMEEKTLSDKQKEFYKAVLLVLSARQKSILQYAKVAADMYKKSPTQRMKRIQLTCERIAVKAPEHFFEAVQLLFFLHEGVVDEQGSGSISFGRLDQYLLPYYKQDIRDGVLNKEEAQQIITALWEKIAQRELSWQNVTLGGSDAMGNDMCNELTIMCMKASISVHKEQPQVSLRVHENMNDDVWKTAFELVRTGMGFPEFYNDTVAVKAKSNCGVSVEDAWNYGIVGCVELSVGGKEYSHTEGMRINWAKLLELVLNNGSCSLSKGKWNLECKRPLESVKTFEELYKWYQRELIALTKRVCEFIDCASKQYSEYWCVPYLSSIMQGCLETGRDVTDCGAPYNNLTVNCVGIASVANSLEAIEKLVFNERLVTLQELATALSCNFEGYEWLQNKMLACPKYGNNIKSVDDKMAELINVFTTTLGCLKPKYRSGKYQAGFYTSYFHSTMGEFTGATPDGRYAREALSSSLSPMTGTDVSGPIAVVQSANRIDMTQFGNGMVLDMKFTSAFLEKEIHCKGVRFLVEEYFAEGVWRYNLIL